MTHDEFLSLIKQPEQIEEKYLPALKDILFRHPYFSTARLINTKYLAESNDVQLSSIVKITNLYTSNRSWFYYYLYPDKQLSTGKYRKDKLVKSSGDYFDMIDTLESQGENNKNTLRGLADRLKSARNMVTQTPTIVEVKEPVLEPESDSLVNTDLSSGQYSSSKHSVDQSDLLDVDLLISLELKAKKFIADRKFSEAIEILRKLNLNNPKKSVYFADQIRFLEKIVENLKK